jgi:uncharacterized protein
MTRIKIKKLIWDDYNVEHIKKHGVNIKDVEIASKNILWHERTKKMRYMAGGRSGKRILTLIIRRKEKTTYYLVSARDSDKKERRKIYEREI